MFFISMSFSVNHSKTFSPRQETLQKLPGTKERLPNQYKECLSIPREPQQHSLHARKYLHRSMCCAYSCGRSDILQAFGVEKKNVQTVYSVFSILRPTGGKPKNVRSYLIIRAGLIEGKINENKKRNEKTKNRTRDYVSFIGQIVKIRSRDRDTSVFIFRCFFIPEDLKKNEVGAK